MDIRITNGPIEITHAPYQAKYDWKDHIQQDIDYLKGRIRTMERRIEALESMLSAHLDIANSIRQIRLTMFPETPDDLDERRG